MNLIPVLLTLKDTKWQYLTKPDSSCTKRSCNIPSVVSILSWDALVIENEVKAENFPTFLIYLLYFAWHLAFCGCQFSSLLVKGNLSVRNFIINHSDNQVSAKHITLQIYFKLLHSMATRTKEYRGVPWQQSQKLGYHTVGTNFFLGETNYYSPMRPETQALLASRTRQSKGLPLGGSCRNKGPRCM